MAVYRPWYRDPKTGERRQSRIWWFQFRVAGRRIRESTGTDKITLAKKAEERRRRELERALVGLPANEPDRRLRTVREVLREYAASYPLHHRPASAAIIQERSKHLERLLGDHITADLTEARILQYITRRRGEGASNRTVNLEILTLSRALGGTWRTLWPRVRRLEENRNAGRALRPEEESKILEAAARNKSPLIYPYLMTLLWTGLRAGEALALTWGRVDFARGEIEVGDSKTSAGAGRVVPIAGPLRAVLEHHRAAMTARFGPLRPDWYVFPYCRTKRPVDPERPALALKTAWTSVRKAAGVECRLHDLRHSFCSKLAEQGVPEFAMLSLMGHVSTAMLRRYSHIGESARRAAIAALERAYGVAKEAAKVGENEAEGGSAKLLN